jgi:hypothetical protein
MINKFYSKKCFLILIFSLFVISCKKDNSNSSIPVIKDEKVSIKLGKKLNNPFTTENMKKAYSNLKSNSSTGLNNSFGLLTEEGIETNAYYIRFLADSQPEMDFLEGIEDDLDIYLYDVPFDYEITVNGDYYHDPSIPLNLPTWQYTAVGTDFDIVGMRNMGVQCEILDELYLPEGYGLEVYSSQNDKKVDANPVPRNQNFTNLLVDEAERIASNEPVFKNFGFSTLSSFNPQGRIQVFDTRLGRLIPLKGVKVRARRWFTIREVTTDDNGNYFSASSFNRPVNYAIFYEGQRFDVRTGTWGQAWLNGPKSEGRWGVNINDGVQRFYAHIFRGAERYHNGNIGDLKRPNVWSKLKYCAYDSNNDNDNGDNWGNWDFTGIFPDIRIWRIVRNRERESDEIFSTTVHETVHASHVQLMNAGEIQYSQVENRIVESWAVGVQWFITSLEYKERGIFNYGDPNDIETNVVRLRRGYQTWSPVVDRDYTSLFIDLVDNFNQKNAGQPFAYNADDVQGYTFGGIESNILKRSYGLHSLTTKLKAHKPVGVTDEQIDNLLYIYTF